MEKMEMARHAWKVVFFILLIGVLLGVLTWTGVVKCKAIPGWCDVYLGIINYDSGGQPKVAIVHGDFGMGDPQHLASLLSNPQILGVHPVLIDIENVELGNIRAYNLVIVEKAREIETKKLDIFMDYVLQHGGRLVWTGDAGTIPGRNDRLLYFEQDKGTPICEDVMNANNLTTSEIEQLQLECIFQKDASVVGPWARVRYDDTIMHFDQFLGLNYLGNFCEVSTQLPQSGTLTPAQLLQHKQREVTAAAKCAQDKKLVGKLLPEATKNHPLIKGFRTDIGYFGDLGLVEELGGGFSTRALSLQFDGKLRIQKGDSNKVVELGKILPMIQTSQVGERVAYYASPPEIFASPPMNYLTIVENVFIGMVRG